VGALVIAALFAVIVSFTSSVYPLQDQPKSEINLAVPGPGPGHIRTYVNPAAELNKGHLIKQGYDFSCGSAALAIILNFYLGEKFMERQVIAGLMHYGDEAQIAKRQAFSLLDMKKFVNVLGYEGEGYRGELSDLQELTVPCIVPIKLLNYRHFVVFRGIYKGHIFLADPWRGNLSLTLDDFMDIWYERVMFVISAPEGMPTMKALKLKPQDLVYIDEDTALQFIFYNKTIPELAESERVFKLFNDIPGEFQYYRVKK